MLAMKIAHIVRKEKWLDVAKKRSRPNVTIGIKVETKCPDPCPFVESKALRI